ncbi:MAG: carboxypeptidase M32 [Steroidobacteraceae bacterium]
MAQSPYEQLEQEWRRLHTFRGALSLLRWDAAVMMPRGSADVRGEQLATLESECHALLTAPKVSRLLERAEANRQCLEDWQVANLREMRRQRDHAIALPVRLITRLAKATAAAEAGWIGAQQSGFATLVPLLEEVLQLTRDRAALLGQALNLPPYDALLDLYSPGITADEVEQIFRALGRRLPQLINETIVAQQRDPALALTGKFAPGKQRQLAMEVMRAIGFPFDRGRLDEAPHPFTEGVHGDVRVATHFRNTDVFHGLLGALHETGHALYDMGLPREWRDQPVGRDRGVALEQSQALLLEMIVARSRAFVAYLRPLLGKYFDVSGPEWEPENIYRQLTRVQRSCVRIDADELTYPVHVMIRFELERELLDGKLAVRNLAEAWNAAMESRLGVRPQTDVEGCLQDVHWALGSFGYFPAYALGGVIAAQLNEAMRRDLRSLDSEIANGDFRNMYEWLGKNVYMHGARIPMPQLLKEATGKPLSAASAVRYLEAKYLDVDKAQGSAAA